MTATLSIRLQYRDLHPEKAQRLQELQTEIDQIKATMTKLAQATPEAQALHKVYLARNNLWEGEKPSYSAVHEGSAVVVSVKVPSDKEPYKPYKPSAAQQLPPNVLAALLQGKLLTDKQKRTLTAQLLPDIFAEELDDPQSPKGKKEVTPNDGRYVDEDPLAAGEG